MRVYRTVVNQNEIYKGDVIHYIIKDGVFFFSEADLAVKHRIYGRTDTDNVVIPVGNVMRFLSVEQVKEKYPDTLNLTSYRDYEVQCVALFAKGNHTKLVISFEIDENFIEIIE